MACGVPMAREQFRANNIGAGRHPTSQLTVPPTTEGEFLRRAEVPKAFVTRGGHGLWGSARRGRAEPKQQLLTCK